MSEAPRTSLYQHEIEQQPEAVRGFLDSQTAAASRISSTLQRSQPDWVLIAARGSSDNAARYGQYVLGIRNRLPVALAAPSLFTIYGSPPRLDGAFVIGISQSGESPDVIAVLSEAHRQRRPTLAITNHAESPLAAAADDVLPFGIGEERAVAASKTYTTSLAALALLSVCLSGDSHGLEELHAVPAAMSQALTDSLARRDTMRILSPGVPWLVVSRGMNYGTGFETALKLKEVAGISVESYSSADFLHGPIAAVGPGSIAVLIAPDGPAFEGVTALVPALKERGVVIAAVSDRDDLLAQADCGFPLPIGVPEWLSPLTAILPGQVLALDLALGRGFDPDAPLGLRKITRTL